jgi:exonuclease III
MVNIVQLNLGRRDIAAKELQLWVANPNNLIDILLLQEPKMHDNKIMDIKGGIMLYTGKELTKPARTTVWISDRIKNKVNGELLESFSNRDLTTVKLTLNHKHGGSQKIIFCSAYCPAINDNAAAIKEPLDHTKIKLIEYVRSNNLELIFAGDFNAHNKAFGDKKNDARGNWLVDYLMGTNLFVLNQGKEPTFEQNNSSSVIDLTLATPGAARRISKWHLDKDFVFSDHKAVCFELESQVFGAIIERIKRRTNWIAFQKAISDKCEGLSADIRTKQELENRANNFREILFSSYKENCRERVKKEKFYTEWYSKELEEQRKRVRKAHSNFNKATDSAEKGQFWNIFKELRDEYKKKCCNSKKQSWRKFAGEVDNIKEVARLQKILEKGKTRQLTGLLREDGSYTDNMEDCVRELMNTHFPECKEMTDNDEITDESKPAAEEEWKDIDEAVTENKIRWALDCLLPYKSPGEDDNFPALLQKSEATSSSSSSSSTRG